MIKPRELLTNKSTHEIYSSPVFPGSSWQSKRIVQTNATQEMKTFTSPCRHCSIKNWSITINWLPWIFSLIAEYLNYVWLDSRPRSKQLPSTKVTNVSMAQKAWQKANMHRATKRTLQRFFYQHASSKQHFNAKQRIKGEQIFPIT